MAHTITATTLNEGKRNVVLLVSVVSDGASGDLAAATLITRASYAADDGAEFAVERLQGACVGITANLLFAASANLLFARLNNSPMLYDFLPFGGISSNKAGAGATGNILITTTGLAVAGTGLTYVFELRKN